MKSVDVCLSPELIDLYGVEDKIVVVVDVLRATSCMTTAMAHGVDHIVPVTSLDICQELRSEGYLGAAERNGQKVDGFEFGNSPFSYMDPEVKGKKVAVTTTNGTVALEKSIGAIEVLVGSFLNLTAISNYLIQKNEDVLVFCAGWKGRVNLEDTLFAGAVVEALEGKFSVVNDSAMLAAASYKDAKSDLMGYLANCNHVQRLSKLNIGKDIEFCLKLDEYPVIPKLVDGKITLG